MKQVVKVLSVAALMLFAGSNATAQFRQGVFLNGNIPTGNFASSISNASVPLMLGGIGREANIGFGAGYRASYRFDVGIGEVAAFVQADLFWNTIDGDIRDMYAGHNYKSPNYFNVPLLAGVSYLYDELWNDITPYAEFGLGADFFLITSEGTGKGNERFRYSATPSFAWMIGLGSYFGRHVSAGVYYYGMGKHYLSYTSKTLSNNTVASLDNTVYNLASTRESRTVGSLAIRIGFHF